MALDRQGIIDTDAIDLAQEKPSLAEDVAVWPVWENGVANYRLESRRQKRFYRVGYREYAFLSLLDGGTSVAAACGLAASQLGTNALTSDECESIVVWLLGEGLATMPGSTPGRPSTAADATKGKRFNPFWVQVPLAKSSETLQHCLGSLTAVFSRLPTVAGLCTVLVGGVAYALNAGELHRSSGDVFSATGWLYFLITWMMLKIVHELGHAVACKKVGGEVAEMGIVFMLFAPLAYVDVTSCWRLPKPLSRIYVSLAGMYVELVIAGLAMIMWLVCESTEARFWLANLVVTAGVSTLLFNANPLMRFDGYYVLSDATQIPNLYGEANAELQRLAQFLFYGEFASKGHYRGGRRCFLILYGFAALLWRLMICFALCVTASMMFSGAGVLLAAMALVAWFGQPLRQFMQTAVEDWEIDRASFFRSVAVGSLLLVSSAAVFMLPLPTSISLPAVVHDSPGAEIRSVAEGFIANVHVRDGESVGIGQPLLTLENRELEAQLKHLELNRSAATIRQRMATNSHDASAAWVARQERVAIERQIGELRPKVDGLRVVAPHAGVVTAMQLDDAIGRFVREGDELLRISGAGPKEAIAAAHQDEIEAVRGSLHRTAHLSDIRLKRFPTTIQAVQPRATRQLPDPALSALLGGPLRVQQISETERDSPDENVRLLEPHFIVRAAVGKEDEAALMTGSRIRLLLGYRRLSLWARAQVALSKFWNRKQKEQQGKRHE